MLSRFQTIRSTCGILLLPKQIVPRVSVCYIVSLYDGVKKRFECPLSLPSIPKHERNSRVYGSTYSHKILAHNHWAIRKEQKLTAVINERHLVCDVAKYVGEIRSDDYRKFALSSIERHTGETDIRPVIEHELSFLAQDLLLAKFPLVFKSIDEIENKMSKLTLPAELAMELAEELKPVIEGSIREESNLMNLCSMIESQSAGSPLLPVLEKIVENFKELSIRLMDIYEDLTLIPSINAQVKEIDAKYISKI